MKGNKYKSMRIRNNISKSIELVRMEGRSWSSCHQSSCSIMGSTSVKLDGAQPGSIELLTLSKAALGSENHFLLLNALYKARNTRWESCSYS